MQFYQVFIGLHEFNPFEGFASGLVHKTLEGAWSEIGDILEGVFQEYYLKALTIKDIDVNVNSRHVLVSYERIGSSGQTMVYSIQIEPVSVVQ